jgi:DNA invertase Pin-like site-specific DNA recombinase
LRQIVPVADRLAAAAAKIRRTEKQLAKLKASRDQLILEAIDDGMSTREVARLAGVSVARPSQIKARDTPQ